jgi:hypothetical protein
MAIVKLTSENKGNVQIVTWTGLTTDDTGQPWYRADYSDKCVQVFGDFGTNATVTLQGSNDPRVISDPANAVWFSLTDPQANAIAKAAAAGEQILENPVYIRPVVTSGTSPNLTVIISATKGY